MPAGALGIEILKPRIWDFRHGVSDRKGIVDKNDQWAANFEERAASLPLRALRITTGFQCVFGSRFVFSMQICKKLLKRLEKLLRLRWKCSMIL